MNRFLGMPTRGGWLTLLNCAFWALCAWTEFLHGILPNSVALLLIICFGLPAAYPLGLGIEGLMPRRQGVIAWCVLVGLNSIAWGYGLSWVVSAASRAWLRRRQQPGHCARCGYDLRATPDRCPECGRAVVV